MNLSKSPFKSYVYITMLMFNVNPLMLTNLMPIHTNHDHLDCMLNTGKHTSYRHEFLYLLDFYCACTFFLDSSFTFVQTMITTTYSTNFHIKKHFLVTFASILLL